MIPEIATKRRMEVESAQAGASAHERTNKECGGAQEHNEALTVCGKEHLP